jgi:hypothetical protein
VFKGRRRFADSVLFVICQEQERSQRWCLSRFHRSPDDVDADEGDFMLVEDSSKEVLIRQPSSALQWLYFLVVGGSLAVILCTKRLKRESDQNS